MWGCMCLLIFWNSELRYAFHCRSRVRRDGGRYKGNAFPATGLVLWVAGSGDIVCAGVRGQRGCCAARAKPVTNSKHVDVRHQFPRELIVKRAISITHVRSAWQHADSLAKPLSAGAFQFHRNFVMRMK